MSQIDLFERDKFKVIKPKTGARSTSNIDLIYTLQGADATCCLAVRAGLKYGIQSKSFRLCPYLGKHKHGEHKVMFIDNEYHKYDHAEHLAGLATVQATQGSRVKYATVRDVMSREQCEAAGIQHYSFDQIMAFAEDVERYAENVIVIPKYDCIAVIPDKYILGYSVPSSHGGTPLLPEAFLGRRVHLLGGSWKDQISIWLKLWNEVVSIDNNWVNNIARYGQFTMPNGTARQINKDLHLSQLVNPRYVALALSFGHMIAQVKYLEMYTVGVHST